MLVSESWVINIVIGESLTRRMQACFCMQKSCLRTSLIKSRDAISWGNWNQRDYRPILKMRKLFPFSLHLSPVQGRGLSKQLTRTLRYDRVVSGVLESPQRQRTTAMRVIKWVVCARRPLKWREVQASFFIDPKNSDCDYQDRRLRKSCKKLCSSLIDLQFGTEKTPTEASLHLVHDTARE